MKPLDDELIAETVSWLKKAERDMIAAEGVLTLDPPLTDDSVFHCQQAVEKLIKAFLVWHDTPFRRTHDLGALGHACIAIDESLESILREAAPLTEYAWSFRYPGEPEEPDIEEVHRAIAIMRQVHQAIIERLPEEIRGS